MSRVHVVQKVNQLLASAVSTGVSDIHFEPFEDVFRVRYRIDGVLKDVEHLPYAQKEEIISRIKIMSDLDIAEKRRPQDGKLVFGVSNKNVDVRVSVLPTQFGEKVVLRLLDREQVKLDISSLGMDDHEIEIFRKCIHLPYGMILVTGPTGSGKTTSLYSALSEINSEKVNITTIEDPIEYNLPGINQTQVHDKINYTFASILRTILRQDPDIIMIGEMRDTETADVSIRAALTGHLVLSTLHTNDAISTIVRLLHLDIEPFLIASSLRLIIAQRLIRVNCSHCNEAYTPDERVLHELGLLDSKSEFYRGRGCEECNHTGYKGRTGVFEILPISDELSNMIIERRSNSEIRSFAVQNGMRFLLENAVAKVKQGLTTPEEVLRKIKFQLEGR